MKEVKSPKKPLLYYYGIVLLIILAFNLAVREPGDGGGLRHLHGHDR